MSKKKYRRNARILRRYNPPKHNMTHIANEEGISRARVWEIIHNNTSSEKGHMPGPPKRFDGYLSGFNIEKGKEDLIREIANQIAEGRVATVQRLAMDLVIQKYGKEAPTKEA